jgi:hypothetical protein
MIRGSVCYKPPSQLINFKAHRRAPARPAARSGGPVVAAGLHEVEGQLRHRLVTVQLIGRVPRACDGRRLGGQAEMGQDALHGLSLGDDRHDLEPASALRAFQDIHGE